MITHFSPPSAARPLQFGMRTQGTPVPAWFSKLEVNLQLDWLRYRTSGVEPMLDVVVELDPSARQQAFGWDPLPRAGFFQKSVMMSDLPALAEQDAVLRVAKDRIPSHWL